MRYSVTGLLLLGCTLPVMAEPVFEPRQIEGGPPPQYTGGWEFFVGGGVASFDCNGDQFPELFVAGGSSKATLLWNITSGAGDPIKFTADTPANLALTGVTGAYPLDVDSDGILDLFIMRVGENRLLRGGPDCQFDDFPELGFDGGNRWTTAFSAAWEPGNDLPTLAIGNYVDRIDPNGPFEACDINVLMRPTGHEYTTTPLTPGYCPLSMLFSDWGHTGRSDLRISNDRHYYVHAGQEQMWAMEETPRPYTAQDGWAEHRLWGMGIASRDISGDGIPEILLTSMGDQKLQMLDVNSGGPTFVDATYERGTTAQRPYLGDDGRPSTGWHAEFGDVNNDGRDDVFIAKGNVDQMPDSAMADPNNLLVQQANGTFVEKGATAGVASMARGRGGALVDLNLDGLLDLVVVNRRAPLELYQNTTRADGNWLLLNLSQPGTNRRAIGAWVELQAGGQTWHREITIGGGHASGEATFLHFGLGPARTARLRIIWPDGTPSHWSDITANQIWNITRAGADFSQTAGQTE